MKNKKLLAKEQLYLPTKRLMVDWNRLFEHLFIEGTISKEDAIKIIKTATKFFASEPNLIYLEDPVTIVGDIHGYSKKIVLRRKGNIPIRRETRLV